LDTIVDLDPEEMLERIKRTKTEESQCIDLCRSLVSKEPWKQVCALLRGLPDDPEQVRRAVLGYGSKVLLSGKDDPRLAYVLACFQQPFYDTGRPGLILACYEATHVDK